MLVHFWINYSSSHARKVQSFLVLGKREQGTLNWEQGTLNWEQGTLNWELLTGNDEPF